MSRARFDSFDDEKIDEMIAGCRALRAQRAQWIDNTHIIQSAADHDEDHRNYSENLLPKSSVQCIHSTNKRV